MASGYCSRASRLAVGTVGLWLCWMYRLDVGMVGDWASCRNRGPRPESVRSLFLKSSSPFRAFCSKFCHML